jgi:hypothetical protein
MVIKMSFPPSSGRTPFIYEFLLLHSGRVKRTEYASSFACFPLPLATKKLYAQVPYFGVADSANFQQQFLDMVRCQESGNRVY